MAYAAAPAQSLRCQCDAYAAVQAAGGQRTPRWLLQLAGGNRCGYLQRCVTRGERDAFV